MISFIFLYLLAQLAIGFWVSKKVHNSTDFFLAGRSMPLFVVTLSLVATWFGAETCIGSSGAVFAEGLSGSRADPFGYSMCLLLLGLVMAAPLWRGGYITLSDLYADRYGPIAEKVSALVIIPGSIIWAAAQIRAFGQIVSSLTDLPVEQTILFCTAFIMIYTFLGGLLGDIITDVIQGLFIVIGLVGIFVLVFISPDFSWDLFAEQTSQRLSFIAPGESLLERIDRWSIPILGSMVAQELISRTLSAKSASVAKQASFLAAGTYLLLGLLPVLLGLIGPSLIGSISDAEQFLPILAAKYLNPFFYVLFIGALISAILSTIDSIFLSVSAVASQNIIYHIIKPQNDGQKLLIARLVVIVGAIISYVIAKDADGIYDLLESASSFGTAGLLVITLFGLWTKFGRAWAAVSSLVLGTIFYPIGESILKLSAPFVATIAVAFAGFIIGALIDKKNSPKGV